MVIGGPALVMWLTPTEEEIFKVSRTRHGVVDSQNLTHCSATALNSRRRPSRGENRLSKVSMTSPVS
jgi:hypothetical protein